jgi:hypothetical protein
MENPNNDVGVLPTDAAVRDGTSYPEITPNSLYSNNNARSSFPTNPMPSKIRKSHISHLPAVLNDYQDSQDIALDNIYENIDHNQRRDSVGVNIYFNRI